MGTVAVVPLFGGSVNSNVPVARSAVKDVTVMVPVIPVPKVQQQFPP